MLDFQHDILPLKNIIFRTALRIVLNREEAEDIVQDILVKMWEQRNELEKVNNLEVYALRAARNLAIDRMEKMDNRHVSLNSNVHLTAKRQGAMRCWQRRRRICSSLTPSTPCLRSKELFCR